MPVFTNDNCFVFRHECHCGNELNITDENGKALNDEECQVLTCPGDGSELCGDSSKLMLYRTGRCISSVLKILFLPAYMIYCILKVMYLSELISFNLQIISVCVHSEGVPQRGGDYSICNVRFCRKVF